MVAALLIFFATRGGDTTDSNDSTDVAEVNDGVGVEPVSEPPEQVALFVGVANADGTFTFSWEPVSQEGATYLVVDEGVDAPARLEVTTYTGPTSCIDVATVASSGLISAPVRGCVG